VTLLGKKVSLASSLIALLEQAWKWSMLDLREIIEDQAEPHQKLIAELCFVEAVTASDCAYL
jgi:hypothetical protein